MKNTKPLKIIVIVFQIAILLFYNYFCWMNGANYTGGNVKQLALISFGFGALIYVFAKMNNKSDKFILTILILAILFGMNILLLDHYNIMMNYEDWLEKGMPAKPHF